jgi:DNA-binding NarL/FixJ family response regulator
VNRPIRVVIADDHAMVREGVRHVLGDAKDIEVVADVADGPSALEAIQTHRPDVALIDLTMPGADGFEVVRRTREVSPPTRVVVLSMHRDGDSVAGALSAGAQGYLLKDEAGPSELRAATRAVVAGERFFSAGVATSLASVVESEEHAETPGRLLDRLTPRELQVLEGIAAGLSNKQIAAPLNIGRRTVETHRESLMRKLDIRTVAGLTRFAIEAGIPDPDTP